MEQLLAFQGPDFSEIFNPFGHAALIYFRLNTAWYEDVGWIHSLY